MRSENNLLVLRCYTTAAYCLPCGQKKAIFTFQMKRLSLEYDVLFKSSKQGNNNV